MKKLILATLAALALTLMALVITACGESSGNIAAPNGEGYQWAKVPDGSGDSIWVRTQNDTILVHDTISFTDTITITDTLHYLVATTDTINDTLVVPIIEYDTTSEEFIVVDTLYTKKEKLVYINDTVYVTDTVKQVISETQVSDTLVWKELSGLYTSKGVAVDQCDLRGMRLATDFEVDSLIYAGAIVKDMTGTGGFFVETDRWDCNTSYSSSSNPWTVMTFRGSGSENCGYNKPNFNAHYSWGYSFPEYGAGYFVVCVKEN